MVKLRNTPDVGDGDIIKELHRTIQFSKAHSEGKIRRVDEKIWSWDSGEPVTGL